MQNPHDRLFRQAFLGTLLKYLVQVAGQLDQTALQTALRQALPPTIGETIMPTLAETWFEEGLEKGREEGLKEGILLERRSLLTRLLSKKFGTLPINIVQNIDQATQADLERWIDQVLPATSLRAIFPDADK